MKLGKASFLMTDVGIALIGGTVRGESKPEPKLENLFQQTLTQEFGKSLSAAWKSLRIPTWNGTGIPERSFITVSRAKQSF